MPRIAGNAQGWWRTFHPTVVNPRGVNTSRFISSQKLVCSWPVGIEATPIAIFRVTRVFGDQIHHIRAQPVDPVGPELRLFSALRVPLDSPSWIRLFWCKEMQIVLFAFCMPAPRTTTEFLNASCSVAFLVLHRARYKTGGKGFFVQRLAKPGMLGRGMVKHHIENDTNPRDFCLCHQFVKIVQRAIGGINRRIIRYVVTVIDTGRT